MTTRRHINLMSPSQNQSEEFLPGIYENVWKLVSLFLALGRLLCESYEMDTR
jgi:hypothetical protein